MIKPIFKRTKILATIGPATSSYEMIYSLIEAGVNGCRLNFSHGSHAEKKQQIVWIRQASFALGKPVAIVQDLQGPKIRLGVVNKHLPLKVESKQEWILGFGATFDKNKKIIPIQYNLADKVKPEEVIYLCDGKIKGQVIGRVSASAIKIRLSNSGEIRSNGGINLPDTDFDGDILTAKDLHDIEFGSTQDIDYVALSFVQSAENIQDLRQILKSHNSSAKIIAKIETKKSIEPAQLESIVKESDAIMVARGDLAIEVGVEIVPAIQDQIVKLTRQHSKLVIVATQMLSTMTKQLVPTRAEASDVATAVMQGVDTVMLSEETANGEFPLETVATMKKIILYTQTHSDLRKYVFSRVDFGSLDSISKAAVDIANNIDAQAIIVETKTGATALRVANMRPNRVILSVTSEAKTAQQLALSYANQSYVREFRANSGLNLAKELKNYNRFDSTRPVTVVIISGRQIKKTGVTDTVQVRTV